MQPFVFILSCKGENRRANRHGRHCSASCRCNLWRMRLHQSQLRTLQSLALSATQLRFCKFRHACPENHLSSVYQGRNHGWKVKGDQGLCPNTEALAPRAQPKAGLGVGCGRGSPPSAVRVRGYHSPKTQMLNTAFWWLLAVKFLAFKKPLPRSWGTNTLLVSQPKSWGTSLPGLYGCCAYGVYAVFRTNDMYHTDGPNAL